MNTSARCCSLLTVAPVLVGLLTAITRSADITSAPAGPAAPATELALSSTHTAHHKAHLVKTSTGAPTQAGFYCTDPQRTSTVQGHPHVAPVPALESVGLVPKSGGLMVTFSFHKPFALAPEGVYLAWDVFVFRHRSDAQNLDSQLQLQVEDRGKGWQPTGWTILASIGTADSLVQGQVHTNKAHNQFTTYFPGGFANLSPPFYWFASQEEYRAYLPVGSKAGTQDWNVNGAIFTDCPAGVRPDPDSSPYGAKLLTVTA